MNELATRSRCRSHLLSSWPHSFPNIDLVSRLRASGGYAARAQRNTNQVFVSARVCSLHTCVTASDEREVGRGAASWCVDSVQLQACNRVVWDNAHPRAEDVSGRPDRGGKGQKRPQGQADEMGDPVHGAPLTQMGLVESEGGL
jgi:hypothetical protein